jgi:soluble lytic murein transglycosylase-like protein
MKTWMLLAAAALAPLSAFAQSSLPPLTLLPLNVTSQVQTVREIEAARTALLPEPQSPAMQAHNRKLNEIKASVSAAKTPAELEKVRGDFKAWRTAVMRDLYAGDRRENPGESFAKFDARRTNEIAFVLALRQQFAAQRVDAEAGAVREVSRNHDSTSASWAHLFDNQSPFHVGSAAAPVSDGAVKVEPLAGAARFKKIRDIAVHSWGANPRIVDAAINEAMRQNVDPALVLSVIWQESRFNVHATSSCGARGLMQVMPDTGKGLGVSNPDNLYDMQTNLRAGIQYLRNAAGYLKLHLDLSDVASAPAGKIKALLASYNAGCGAVAGWIRKQGPDLYRIPYAETRDYVRIIAAKLASLA